MQQVAEKPEEDETKQDVRDVNSGSVTVSDVKQNQT